MVAKLKIAEIASKTGLSISTVSRVLAGKANTSAHTKQIVLDCARAEGVLEKIPASRVLFNQLLVFAPARAFDARTDLFYYNMIQGIRAAIEPHDTHVSYCPLEEENSDTQLFIKRMADPAIEGAIIIGVDDPKVHDLADEIGKPCVLLNCCDSETRLDTVLPDHLQIGQSAANHLLALGHREIATMICLRRFTLERRLDGVRNAFAMHNRVFDESRYLITTSGFSAEESEQALDAYLELKPRAEYPTAILVIGHLMAAGAARALKRRGLRVPDDVSLMGIDGYRLAPIEECTLSTCHVPCEELGQEAITLLQRRVTHPHAPICNLFLCGGLSLGSSVKRAANRRLTPAVSTHDHGLYGA
jgi:DNA-binding LacI/PurR family transcriptional regulator